MPEKASGLAVTRRRLIELAREYSRIYLRPWPKQMALLEEISATYDAWFRGEFIAWLESQITRKGENWQLIDAPRIEGAARRMIRDNCSRIIVQNAADWYALYADDFYTRGIQLYALNYEMDTGQKPPKASMALHDDEVQLIAANIQVETNALQEHLDRHSREITRYIHAGLTRGITTAEFNRWTTCVDGHVCGWRYGNAMYSWREHLRRMGVGRSKMLQQLCVEHRMSEAVAGLEWMK